MQLSVGNAIRAYRKQRGWSQAELGTRAGGVDKGTVNRIELGGNTNVDTLLKIARALEVELEITLRDATGQGQAQRFRDILPSVVTSSVTSPVHALGAPGEETIAVPNPSLPQSPVHLTLYGLIGDLTEEQARTVRRPLLELIERTQQPEPPPPEKKKDKGTR